MKNKVSGRNFIRIPAIIGLITNIVRIIVALSMCFLSNMFINIIKKTNVKAYASFNARTIVISGIVLLIISLAAAVAYIMCLKDANNIEKADSIKRFAIFLGVLQIIICFLSFSDMSTVFVSAVSCIFPLLVYIGAKKNKEMVQE